MTHQSTATSSVRPQRAHHAKPSAPRPQQAAPRHRRPPTGSDGLRVSTASNDVVQPQGSPGSCHQIGSGVYSRPDPACTPGALNPQVTQATIHGTICVSGWTATVRPAEAITEPEKAASMAAYGDTGPLGAYEYDHFVPLELGGATNDPRNLWPEPGASPNPKDAVEGELRRQVCDGQMSLRAAQHAIVANWVSLARRTSSPPRSAPPASTSTPVTSGHCTARAAYSSRYHDYDVYVHSNQPDQTVTVTDATGRLRSWHTDGAGSADVYFNAGGVATGRRITVHVGAATCYDRL